MLDHLFPACPPPFFFKWRLARTCQFHFFMPGSVHSGSGSWDDCGWAFPDELRVSSFPERFPNYACSVASSAYSDFIGSRVFRCNLPPALLAEWPGSFTWHCGNTGVERTLSKSQHTKLTLEKKILPPLPAGIRTCNLSITGPALYQQVIPASSLHEHFTDVLLKTKKRYTVLDFLNNC